MKFKKLVIISLALNLLASTYFSYKIIVKYYLQSGSESENWYRDSRNSHFKTLKLSKIDTVFIGASIIQHAEWNELLSGLGLNIKNRAIKGSKVQNVSSLLPSILKANPRNIFLMVGYNDLSKNEHYSEFIKSYQSIINSTFQLSLSQLYILSITPAREDYGRQDNINKIINTANSDIKKACKNSRCHYINIHDLLVDANGQLDKKYTFDGLHLNGKGYQIISNRIKFYLN